VLLCATALFLSASAARPSADQRKNVRFEHVSLEEGLSQAFVASTLQDRDGFMWFGTQEGLNRYDGYDFKIFSYDPEDPTSLSNNFVKTIYEDRNEVIWVGTDGGGVNLYNPLTESFDSFRHDPEDPDSLASDTIWAICQDGMDTIWVGTDGGLHEWQPEAEIPCAARPHPPGLLASTDPRLIRCRGRTTCGR